tara:strand:- start:22053 stop:23084 length:1032 start_codon:yes stop_codon:yes gene_type:complete
MNKKSILLNRWLNVCCLLVFIMILVGGATRLTQSGLSMVDWKPLMGIVPPLNDNQWNASFNNYKKYPEYQKINQFKNMDLSDYKSIYYWEYSHRMLGRIIGLFFIIPFFILNYKGYLNRKIKIPLLISIFLVIFQGILGWFMVKSGLVNNPHVSHYRLASHLLLAFLLFGYIYWIKLNVQYVEDNNESINKKTLSKHVYFILILYVFQVLFGAFIAGTKAGLLWNTFPLMEGKLIPNGLWEIKPFYLNFFENMKMFQFSHRILGTIIMIYSGWFFVATQNEFYNKYSGLLFMAFLIQFYVGIMTLLLKVPLLFGVLHQGIGALILLILVHIQFLISNSKPINR